MQQQYAAAEATGDQVLPRQTQLQGNKSPIDATFSVFQLDLGQICSHWAFTVLVGWSDTSAIRAIPSLASIELQSCMVFLITPRSHLVS